jgi:hypothetical protein
MHVFFFFFSVLLIEKSVKSASLLSVDSIDRSKMLR